MAQPINPLQHLLELASTRQWRTTLLLAAGSFALCHILAVATAGVAMLPDVQTEAEVPVQLLHAMAVMARFVLPLVFFIAGASSLVKLRR